MVVLRNDRYGVLEDYCEFLGVTGVSGLRVPGIDAVSAGPPEPTGEATVVESAAESARRVRPAVPDVRTNPLSTPVLDAPARLNSRHADHDEADLARLLPVVTNAARTARIQAGTGPTACGSVKTGDPGT
ncbi:hypothetical protein KBX37_19305 [Micromonospora sp. U56]|uniref:hypothetical protein n=1 Tax=Micromonospora sp. U56 TaxID=2824900 RepID=UPI001B3803E7|nr:hypothetical protein [Micromonospora sp. U56]MBQ0895222.1 hypothetical protein [Micromonospora sp. U56]